MRARFIGDPNNGGEGPQSLSLFGVDFIKGEWADVPAAFEVKVRGNCHFEVDANEDGAGDPTPDEMRAMLDQLGVKYHHKAGAAKLAELLREALAQPQAEETSEEA